MTSRILIVDDEDIVIRSCQRILADAEHEVQAAHNGFEAVRMVDEGGFDLVILDIMMPGLDGLEVLRRLRAANATLPVLMLTGKDAPSDQVEGLEAGADDYVVKPFTFEVLSARVRALLRRQHAEEPPILRFADLSLDPTGRVVRRGQRELTLTSVEFKLLEEFMRHPKHVLSKEALLDRVWGFDFGGNMNVVEVYVKQLRQKLEAGGEDRLIQTIYGAGYVLRQE